MPPSVEPDTAEHALRHGAQSRSRRGESGWSAPRAAGGVADTVVSGSEQRGALRLSGKPGQSSLLVGTMNASVSSRAIKSRLGQFAIG